MKPLSEKEKEAWINDLKGNTEAYFYKSDIKQALKEFKEELFYHVQGKSFLFMTFDKNLNHLLKKHFGTLVDEEPKTEVKE